MFVSRVEWLVSLARQLSEAADAGDAFFEFFTALVAEAAANHGLAEALTGAGFDIKAAVSGPERDVSGAMAGLLAAAQQAGAVRADVDADDVLALVDRLPGPAAGHQGRAGPLGRRRLRGAALRKPGRLSGAGPSARIASTSRLDRRDGHSAW